jgi:hypothetical protein
MKKIELKPSCIFVNHHVANVTADKTAEGRQKFLDSLDDMTVKAAKAEHCEGQYKHFNDVIDFSDETDVFNFNSLWDGNPPMAPVNPAYCDSSLKLRKFLFKLCFFKKCLLGDFISKRLISLQKAVLIENFVFSFQNTLDVEAYNILNAEYGRWSWRFQEIILRWQYTIRNLVKSCAIKDLDKLKDEQTIAIETDLDVCFEQIMKDFAIFFETSSLATLCIKWQSVYDIKIKKNLGDCKVQVQRFCHGIIFNAKLDHLIKNHQDLFNTRVKDTISKENLTEQELDEIFEDEWNKWIKSIEIAYPVPTKQDFAHNIINSLRRKLHQYDYLILTKVQSLQKVHSLELKIRSKHLNFKTTEVATCNVPALKSKAQHFTTNLLLKSTSYFQKLDIVYDDSHIYNSIDILFDSINKFECEESGFTFTSDYRIDLVLEVAGYALQMFNDKQEKALKSSPVQFISGCKRKYRRDFKAMFKQ